jgi:hypothetical protein
MGSVGRIVRSPILHWLAGRQALGFALLLRGAALALAVADGLQETVGVLLGHLARLALGLGLLLAVVLCLLPAATPALAALPCPPAPPPPAEQVLPGRVGHGHGLPGAQSARVGKIIELEVDGATEAQLHEIARDLLSNPVVEDYELVVEK